MISEDKVVDRPEYRTIWENKLQQLNHGERITFLCVFCLITSVAVIGNFLTIYVVITRKQRLMFKICLLSLAISDLIYASSCSINYISKLMFNTSALWYLGRHCCTIIPFLQTLSLLSGSMSLVSIALDRYMAIFNRKNFQWEPGMILCLSGVFIIWLLAAGISSPMFFSYETVNIIVVPEDNQENFYIAQLCTITNDDKEGTLYYYSLIFIFVFLPLFITFVSFNTIIACEIYKRRKAPGNFHERKRSKKNNEDSSSTAECDGKTSNDTNSTSIRNNASKDASIEINSQPHQQIFIVQAQQQNNDRCNERQKRQMRMFRVILVLVCVFILFRLPTWIFLLVKLNYFIEARVQWVLNYTFSAIGILNSTVNPFLYTFLSQTIRCTSYIREKCHKLCKLCRSKATTVQGNYANNAAIFAKNDDQNKCQYDNGGVYLGN
ncbi:hypothetical protein PVAND_004172 [Polypedilum vanderplanki]|uniref:G-protein coupled receptors family 1 profile domain-containing protein n=1 Tax=Polypedilum vanderplanki TaxID=319348 RepID=A0A9J6BYA3_POLVA|nr:hypothetical protein PVAND_004172 [Polypedilum vanderplanki]